mgnify:CR=1 FL=1
MKFSPSLLVLLTSTPVALLAQDAPAIVDLAALDRPPERIQTAPVEITPALRAAGTDTVEMDAIIGRDGSVLRVEHVRSAHPEAAQAATAAVRRWRFTPAFADGKPATYRLAVAVAVRPDQVSDATGDAQDAVGAMGGTTIASAEPAFETIPAYPEALMASPVNGTAAVTLFVDASGQPSDPVVEFATRPEFAEPAAAAVLEWAFVPAKRGGEPTDARTLVIVPFTAESATWSPEERDLKARLRYVRSYDEAPRQKSSGPLVYPFDALIANRQGAVAVNIIVDPNGTVAHTTPGGDADPEFLGAVQASLATWTFEPATKAGRPVFGVVAMQFTFDPYRKEFQYDPTTYELIKGLREGTAPIYTLKQATKMPKPTQQVQPAFPVGYEGPFEGDAMIEFIIDAQGRAQLPKVIRATNPELGWAAATAVAQWRFEPAEKDGNPVMCRARVPVRFTATKSGS